MISNIQTSTYFNCISIHDASKNNKCTKRSNTRHTVELIEHKHLKTKGMAFVLVKLYKDSKIVWANTTAPVIKLE